MAQEWQFALVDAAGQPNGVARGEAMKSINLIRATMALPIALAATPAFAALQATDEVKITNTYLSCDTFITETYRNIDGVETTRENKRKSVRVQIQEEKNTFFNIIVTGSNPDFNAMSLKAFEESYLYHEASSDQSHYYVNSASGAKMPNSNEMFGVRFIEIYIDRVRGSWNFETKLSSKIFGTTSTSGSGSCERATSSVPKF